VYGMWVCWVSDSVPTVVNVQSRLQPNRSRGCGCGIQRHGIRPMTRNCTCLILRSAGRHALVLAGTLFTRDTGRHHLLQSSSFDHCRCARFGFVGGWTSLYEPYNARGSGVEPFCDGTSTCGAALLSRFVNPTTVLPSVSSMSQESLTLSTLLPDPPNVPFPAFALEAPSNPRAPTPFISSSSGWLDGIWSIYIAILLLARSFLR